MQIGLDITQAVKRRGRGIARYIRAILPRLADPGLALEATYYIRGERWLRRALVGDIVPGARRAWLPLPFLPGAGRLQLFHSFGNHLPVRSGVPLTFTVHDFRALDRHGGRAMGGNRLRRNIARADGILCLTEHGKDRLLHHYPQFDPRRIAVVPHGVDQDRFRPRDPAQAQAAAGRHGLTRPFFIQLGSWFPHKNLELSIRAFARSRARAEGFMLAFVGGGAPADYARMLDELIRSEGVAASIAWIDDVPGEDLPLLLSAASALLQPSRYEGFGLPLLEAMAVGVPGVVSDSSCLPEVSGGIWPIAGQRDAEGFAEAMDRMALGIEARERAIQAGLERAAGFTWEETAKKTAAFFRRMLEISG